MREHLIFYARRRILHRLGTVTNDRGKVQFTDAAATNTPLRFYRAQQQ
jgi:hypothetical protein